MLQCLGAQSGPGPLLDRLVEINNDLSLACGEEDHCPPVLLSREESSRLPSGTNSDLGLVFK